MPPNVCLLVLRLLFFENFAGGSLEDEGPSVCHQTFVC